MRSRTTVEKTAVVRRFEREHLPRFRDRQLVPTIGAVFELAQAAEAHALMERNENIGKIVLRVPPIG
jgi:NADPH:quinone reductase-like Zn-dependent oxidoreductase